MWPALLRLLQTVGTLSTGYFFNDVATWFNATFLGGSAKTSNDTGGWKWWYVVLIFAILAGVVYGVVYFISMFVPKSKRR